MSRSKCMSCQCEIDNHSLLICEDCIGDNCSSFLDYIVKYDESIIDIENEASDEKNDFLIEVSEEDSEDNK